MSKRVIPQDPNGNNERLRSQGELSRAPQAPQAPKAPQAPSFNGWLKSSPNVSCDNEGRSTPSFNG